MRLRLTHLPLFRFSGAIREIVKGYLHFRNMLTKQQAKEIVDLLYKCEISYADSVMAHLKKSVPGFTDDLEQLPASMFERVKLAAIKKAAEYQKYLQEEETVELEA